MILKLKTLFITFLILFVSFQSIIPNTSYAEYDAKLVKGQKVKIEKNDEFAEFVMINDIENNDKAAIRYVNKNPNHNNFTVCVNAGHGTSGGMRDEVRTKCHPDGTPKVTGGTTDEGSLTAYAVSDGMAFIDGTKEAVATLAEALILKDMLLERGYHVLMIRETDDAQIDNIGRSILANKYADIHVAVHWDATASDKGAYYCKVPEVDSYRKMYPVSELWESHIALGESLISGLRSNGIKIYENGFQEMDLTQTSFSKVPSIDIELGDAISDHGEAQLKKLAEGLCIGIDAFFQEHQDLALTRKIKNTSNDKNYELDNPLDSLHDWVMEKIGEAIDFFRSIFGDIPQTIANLLVTVPDGTWKDSKITYSFDELAKEGETGKKNKFTVVSEGSKDSKYNATLDGKKEKFSRDTEIPVICVDIYHFASGRLKQLDTNFLVKKEDRTPIINFIVSIIHLIIYFSAAILIGMLIWHGINLVKKTISTPRRRRKHIGGINEFIKATLMLVGSILIMALCINFTKIAFQDVKMEHEDELPIRVNVQGDANYSFSTTLTGYLRYRSEIESTDMMMQKLSYAFFYDIAAIVNCIMILAIFARFIALMYLSIIGPIIPELSTMSNKKIINMTYQQWIKKYIIWSVIIFIIAIPYRIAVLELNFKK